VYRYVFRMIAVSAIYVTLHFSLCLFLPSPIAAEYWARELIVVKSMLANSILSPRIIFLGGSSTLFGIDAIQVEKKSGVPAMNMGLHAGMRLKQVLLIGERVVRRGDILVLILEPNFYGCNRMAWNSWQVENALAWDRQYFDNLPLETRIEAIFSAGAPTLMMKVLVGNVVSVVAPKYYGARIRALAPVEVIWASYRSGTLRTRSFEYSAYNIDNRGDMLNNEGARYSGPGVQATEPGDICPDLLPVLTTFVGQVKDKGVRVIVAHAPYLLDGAPEVGWREAETRFSRQLASTGAEILDRREELFFSRTDFFNSNLHLNQTGRDKWTKIAIADLRKLGIGSAETSASMQSQDHPQTAK
jgi:hypothetical protein